jgi:hypothetical protein
MKHQLCATISSSFGLMNNAYEKFITFISKTKPSYGTGLTVIKSPPAAIPDRKAKFAKHNSRTHGVLFSVVELPLLNFALRSGFHPFCSAVESM